MMVKMQHSVQRGFQGYCLSLSGGFSASRLVRWLLGFSACPAASRLRGFSACPAAPRLRGFSASRLLGLSGGFSASRLLGFSACAGLLGFSASRLSRLLGLCRTSRLLGFSASRLVSGFSASRLLGFWSHFWAPFARALSFCTQKLETQVRLHRKDFTHRKLLHMRSFSAARQTFSTHLPRHVLCCTANKFVRPLSLKY